MIIAQVPAEPLILSHKNFSQEEESKTVFSNQDDQANFMLPKAHSEPTVSPDGQSESEEESEDEDEAYKKK